MLSDIAIKGAAQLELSLYAGFREWIAPQSSFISVPLGAGLCVADVALDTVKYPLSAVEQCAFAVLNAAGSACLDECTLSDAYQSLSEGVIGLCVATPAMTLLAPVKLIGHLCSTLPRLSECRPSNREAEAEARMEWIVFPKRTSAAIS